MDTRKLLEKNKSDLVAGEVLDDFQVILGVKNNEWFDIYIGFTAPWLCYPCQTCAKVVFRALLVYVVYTYRTLTGACASDVKERALGEKIV